MKLTILESSIYLYYVVACTLTMIIGLLLIAFYVLSQKSSTVENYPKSDLSTLSTLNTFVNY